MASSFSQNFTNNEVVLGILSQTQAIEGINIGSEVDLGDVMESNSMERIDIGGFWTFMLRWEDQCLVPSSEIFIFWNALFPSLHYI